MGEMKVKQVWTKKGLLYIQENQPDILWHTLGEAINGKKDRPQQLRRSLEPCEWKPSPLIPLLYAVEANRAVGPEEDDHVSEDVEQQSVCVQLCDRGKGVVQVGRALIESQLWMEKKNKNKSRLK